MNFLPYCCLLLLLLVCQQNSLVNSFISPTTAFKYALKLYKGLTAIKSINDSKKSHGPVTQDTGHILGKLNKLSTDFQDLKDRLVSKITNNLRDKLTTKTDKFFEHVKDVQSYYKAFLRYYKKRGDFEESVLKSFADEVTSKSVLASNVRKMYETLFDEDYKGSSIMNIIAEDTSVRKQSILKFSSRWKKITSYFNRINYRTPCV